MGAYATDPLGLGQLLPWFIGMLLAGYALRVATALLLLVGSRWRPGLHRGAMACAPAALRPWLRRAVAGGLLGVALSGVPALASPSACLQPDGVPVLDRATACDAGPAAAAAPDRETASYTVQPGDSLWSIAAGLLGPHADDAAVAAAWPIIWHANTSSIGPDPALIRPGATLTIPAELASGGSR